MATTATPKKPVLKFARNQCIACNNNILDRYHLLSGKRKEQGDLRWKFERFTSLKEDDSYPTKICLRCKVKLDSAVCFKEMCLLSRRNQEENLSRVKRGRIADGESCSPCSKRGVNAGIQEKSSNSTSVRQVSVRVYRRILPARPTATSENQKGKQIQEQHFLSKCGPGNEEVSSFLNLNFLLGHQFLFSFVWGHCSYYSLFCWRIWEPLKKPIKCGLSGMNNFIDILSRITR